MSAPGERVEPAFRAPGDRVVAALSGFSRAVALFKLAVWTVFAAIGPVTFFLMKNYVGVAVTSGIAILIALAVLGPSTSSHPVRPAFRAFMVIQGVVGAGVSTWVLTASPAGWTHEVDSTRQVLTPGPDGTVIGVTFSEVGSVHVRGVDGRWSREPFPGGLSARAAWSPRDRALLVTEARTAILHVRPHPPQPGATAAAWRALRGPGENADVLVTSRLVLLRSRSGLDALHLPHGERVGVAGIGAGTTTACASGDRVLVIQSAMDAADRPGRAWESSDGGLTFLPEPSFGGEGAHCAIAPDGTAYVATSATFAGRLVARAPGGRFEEREAPLARVESILVNPARPQEVWLGGWGGGVFRSVDGARSWEHLGLHGFEVESIHVDFARGTVLAATGSGVYARTAPPR